MTSSGHVGPDRRSERNNRAVIAALAIAVCGLLLLLNWLGSAAVPVSREQFGQLLEAELIASVDLGERDLEAQLTQRVRLRAEGRDALADRVFLGLEAAPSAAEVAAWRERGVVVTQADGRVRQRRETGGSALVLLLLGIGGWHLWSQVRADRRGGGSPRRRLQDLESALAAGTVSQEEYQEQAASIWAEM